MRDALQTRHHHRIDEAVIPHSPHHRFEIHGRLGQLNLAVSATLDASWTVLFGASGSGKSTILRALAGLTPDLQVGFARLEHQTARWQPLSKLPPHHRRLAYDPQQAPLLPHLSVRDNICFPESLRRMAANRSLLPALTDVLELGPLLSKAPHQLSGGERQRVSLARALAVPDAHLLLLDEPFAGLDRAHRDALLPRLRAHLTARKLPVLSVTHDPDEALLLQADVVRLQSGQTTTQGPAALILADEITRLRQILDGP